MGSVGFHWALGEQKEAEEREPGNKVGETPPRAYDESEVETSIGLNLASLNITVALGL